MTRSLAVVGAGPAGAGATYALRDADVDVTVFEKSRGVSGRAATRRKHGCRFDHGANYIKESTGRTTDLLCDLGTDGLVDVEDPVWTFDASGTVEPGDDRDEHKWTWTAGLTQLAKRLFARTDARVVTETRITAVEQFDEGWRLTSENDAYGPFDDVLLTPPAPQTASLLTATKWESQHLPALREAVGAVRYRTIRSVLLHYPFELESPYYALVNTDKDHDIGWLSREECKEGHVPDGESLLVVQMSPEWSTDHLDEPLADVVEEVVGDVVELVGDDGLAEPDWVDDQQWRYALPEDGVDDDIIRRGERDGVYFAGDWVAGDGRVHAALWNGIETGRRIAELG